METTLKMKMLVEWDIFKTPEGFDFDKEFEKELKKLTTPPQGGAY